MFYYDLIVCSLSIIFWIYLIYAIWEVAHHRAPFVPSPINSGKLGIKKISDLLKNKNTPQTIVDAGCGNGYILAALAKKYPQHKFIGIEYNKTLFNYCQKHYKGTQNLTFMNQDMLIYDYSKVDIIYYFGIPALTEGLQNVILNTKKNIDLISIEQTFPKLKLIGKQPFRFLFTHSFVYHYKN